MSRLSQKMNETQFQPDGEQTNNKKQVKDGND